MKKPLAFLMYRETGGECSTIYKSLSKVLPEKRNTLQSLVANRVQTRTLLALLKSRLPCLRGSRSLDQNVAAIGDNINLSSKISIIALTGNTFH